MCDMCDIHIYIYIKMCDIYIYIYLTHLSNYLLKLRVSIFLTIYLLMGTLLPCLGYCE